MSKVTSTLFILLIAWTPFCAKDGREEEGKVMLDIEKYAQQTESTDPGEYGEVYKRFPSTVEGVLYHIWDNLLVGFPPENMTSVQESDPGADTVEQILQALKARGNTFMDQGSPETKFAGLCYHSSLLAVSILRPKGIPCRLRCGFAPYLHGGKKGIDHTIIEVWDKAEGQWQLKDPYDPEKVSYDSFHFAAVAWSNFREKTISDGFYGLYGDGPSDSYRFVRSSLLRDWLNILGHERNVGFEASIRGLEGEEELAYLDSIAHLMMEPDRHFEILEKHSGDMDFDFP